MRNLGQRYADWQTVENAPYGIAILCVFDNGTQMVAYLDFDGEWQDAETREELITNPTHWMMLPPAPNLKDCRP